LFAALLPVSVMHAQDVTPPTGCEFQRYVVLAATPDFGSALADEVRKDLAAELWPRGFGVCAAQMGSGELAAEIELGQPDAATVAIDVVDHTTGKRVGRDVTLARIPVSGRALAIAIAADELLRASWAELVLRRAETEAKRDEARPIVRRDPKRLPISARSSWRYVSVETGFELGLMVGHVHTSSAWDAGSFEVRGQVRPFGRGWLSFGLGGVLAKQVDVAIGEANARGLVLQLTLGACTGETHRLMGCGGGRGSLFWTQFRGSNARAADALEEQASAFVMSGVGQLRVRLTARLSAALELGLGGAVASAVATDGMRNLMGIDRFVLSSALGLGVSL